MQSRSQFNFLKSLHIFVLKPHVIFLCWFDMAILSLVGFGHFQLENINFLFLVLKEPASLLLSPPAQILSEKIIHTASQINFFLIIKSIRTQLQLNFFLNN